MIGIFNPLLCIIYVLSLWLCLSIGDQLCTASVRSQLFDGSTGNHMCPLSIVNDSALGLGTPLALDANLR